MILYAGTVYDSSEQNRLLDELKTRIPQTLAREPLDPECVINAIDRLRQDDFLSDVNLALLGHFDGERILQVNVICNVVS